MFSIYKKELRAFIGHPTGFIVIALFLVSTGLLLWLIPGSFNILDSGYAQVDGLFVLAPWLFLFLIPAVTMRSFAEERIRGTWEVIQTKPLSPWEIVLGKYLAALTLTIFALLPSLIYFLSVAAYAYPKGNVDVGQFFGPYIGLIMLAVVYNGIGLFASVVSGNQVVSFLVAALISFFFYYGFDLMSSFLSGGEQIVFLENLGMHAHYKSMSRGVIDSRDIFYFTGVATLFIYAAVRYVRVKK